MNGKQLANVLAKEQSIPVSKAKQVVGIIFSEMTDALIDGDRVEIRGLGSIQVREYDSYEGRNPKTGETIIVQKKRMPFFKVGKDLKNRVDIPIEPLKPEKPVRPAKKTKPSASPVKTEKRPAARVRKKGS